MPAPRRRSWRTTVAHTPSERPNSSCSPRRRTRTACRRRSRHTRRHPPPLATKTLHRPRSERSTTACTSSGYPNSSSYPTHRTRTTTRPPHLYTPPRWPPSARPSRHPDRHLLALRSTTAYTSWACPNSPCSPRRRTHTACDRCRRHRRPHAQPPVTIRPTRSSFPSKQAPYFPTPPLALIDRSGVKPVRGRHRTQTSANHNRRGDRQADHRRHKHTGTSHAAPSHSHRPLAFTVHPPVAGVNATANKFRRCLRDVPRVRRSRRACSRRCRRAQGLEVGPMTLSLRTTGTMKRGKRKESPSDTRRRLFGTLASSACLGAFPTSPVWMPG